MAARLPAVLLATLLAACGDALPTLPPHGLAPRPLVAAPEGDPFVVGAALRPGTWEADVRVRFHLARRGRPNAEGGVRFLVRQEVRPAPDGTLEAHVRLRVPQREGSAASLVEGLDGLAFVVSLDAAGRPRAGTMRAASPAPDGVERLFEGLWLCGFGGGRAWRPDRPLVRGEVVSRLDLGGIREALRMAPQVELSEPRASGGVRVDLLDEGVVLDAASLVEVDGPARASGLRMAVRLAILTEGRAILDALTGLPRTWTCTETTRYASDDGGTREEVEIRQEVEGSVTAVPEAPGGG